MCSHEQRVGTPSTPPEAAHASAGIVFGHVPSRLGTPAPWSRRRSGRPALTERWTSGNRPDPIIVDDYPVSGRSMRRAYLERSLDFVSGLPVVQTDNSAE